MTSRSSLAGAAIATLGLLFYVYSNPSIASSSPPPQQIQSSDSFAYAQLTVEGDQFFFDEGGRETARSRSLSALLRFFGSNQRPTYVNLLNAIGSRGWEIVESNTSESIVTFKRRL